MPIYTAECPCGKQHDYFSSIADRNEPRPSPCCGLAMGRVLTACNFNKPFEDYECPRTGKPIRSIKEHEDNLKLHGCHVLEKGELEDARRTRERLDRQLEDKLAETAAQEYAKLPEDKKALIAHEVSTTDVTVERTTK